MILYVDEFGGIFDPVGRKLWGFLLEGNEQYLIFFLKLLVNEEMLVPSCRALVSIDYGHTSNFIQFETDYRGLMS